VGLPRVTKHTGGLPAGWMRASGMVILKPCNDDYTKLKAYRSIAMLGCVGKVVETEATELL